MVDTLVLQGSTALSIGLTGRAATAPRSVGVPARSAARSAPDAGPVRLTLTRRGRLLLVGFPVALSVVLLILMGAFLTSQAQAGEGPAQTSPAMTVTVGAGETLWGLASQHAPDRDPRDVVSEMVELNNLRSSVVQAGQSISIPAEG